MPNLDGTGPMGKGTMTGRGLGQCKQTFASKPQIQHEPHPEKYERPNQPINDVFVRRGQNRKG